MAEWEPIRRANQTVRGIDPSAPGLLIIEVSLTPTPPSEWVALWNPYPPNSSYTISYAPPLIQGGRAILRVPDGQAKDAVAMLDAQIKAANKWYEEMVLPRMQAVAEPERSAKEEEARRIEAAKRLLDEIDPDE